MSVGCTGAGSFTDTATETGIGTPADTAWGGTGVASLIAGMKAAVLALTGTLKVQGVAGGTAIPISMAAPATLTTTAVVSAAAEGSHVLKNAAGSLISAYVTTGATAGYLMLFDATSVPADGAVTPAACLYAPAQSTTSIDYQAGAPRRFINGIVAVFSSTGPFTKTASTTAFIEGVVV